jgi:UDP-N-acetylmuramoylalanine--D-glutamate ligase
MNTLHDANVLVLGLGASGLAMAQWCARCGARVRVWDSRLQTPQSPPQVQVLAASVPGATLVAGPADAALLDGVQRVFKSPGLAPRDERIAPLLRAAAERGLAVEGELDLFVQALAELKAGRGYAPQLLAITGTNGKTTTTAMTALLVARAGRRVAAAGNIGPTMLETLAQALDAHGAPKTPAASPPRGGTQSASGGPAPTEALLNDHLPEVWVLELSSFQLHGVKGFEPSAATVLNITQDHLDWHGSMEAYVADKARVFGSHGAMVVNRDDALAAQFAPAADAEKPAGRGRRTRAAPRGVLRFGLDAPRHPGDFGLVVDNGMAWLVRALEADPTLRRRAGEAEEIHLQHLMPADALRVRGRHNAANALAALALASAIGCPLAPMLHGLREYAGEAHRVAPVGSVGGVDAYDDSKGTNVGATVAALEGLGADRLPARLAVILGGDGKGQDFAPLFGPVRRHARAVALIGRDAALIGQALAGCGVATRRFDSLEAATRWAFEQARPGDAVLLSPACASLDMFRDYGHRAEVFVAAVQALAHEQGTVAA